MNYFVVGDIHGEFKSLFFYAKQHPNSKIFVAGDCGIGFEKIGFFKNLFSKFNQNLQKINTHIYMIRGNHDDPKYFYDEEKLNYSNIHLLKDYSIIDDKILVIGGAISKDRDSRKEGIDYWKDEDIIKLTNEELQQFIGIKIIISHECPDVVNIEGPPKQYNLNDEEYEQLLNDINSDRQYLTEVYNILKPNSWYFGHYHRNYEENICGTQFVGLDRFYSFTIRSYQFTIP